MSKRGDGEGSIRQMPGRDLWQYRWTETVNGQRVRRVKYARSKPEAVAALRAATARVDQGQPGLDSASPFKVVAERWRRTANVAQGVGTRSMQTYSGVLRLHVYPVIGTLPIRDVKPSHVADVMGRMADKGLSRAYQHQAHKAISGVFKMAIADELVIRNPTQAVKAPRGGHAAKVVPDRGQVLAMIDRATPDPRMRVFVATLAYSGLRIGEALSLRWADWDGAGTLRVMHTKGGKPRAVPVPAKLQTELAAWRRAQAAERLASIWWSDEDWILSADVGTRWDPHNARKRFRRLVEGDPDNGIDPICPGATPHSLRHATATLLLEEGVPMRVVSELLGHSSTRTTEDVYSHVSARLATEAAAALDRAL